MFSCCFNNRVINSLETDDTLDESDNKKIKKLLVKTKKDNHIGSGISSNIFVINYKLKKLSCKVVKERWKLESENKINVLKKLKKMNSCYFPKFVTNFKLNESNVICYEYVNGTDVQDLIIENNIFKDNEHLVVNFTFQILLALFHLQRLHFVHLDLKPENIILNSLDPMKVTIIDVAFSTNYKKNKKLNKIYGTVGYMAPEILYKNTIANNSDIWSLGIIIFLLIKEKYLFGVDELSYVEILKNSNLVFSYVKESISLLSEKLQKLLLRCLDYNTDYRITITSLMTLIENNYTIDKY